MLRDRTLDETCDLWLYGDGVVRDKGGFSSKLDGGGPEDFLFEGFYGK